MKTLKTKYFKSELMITDIVCVIVLTSILLLMQGCFATATSRDTVSAAASTGVGIGASQLGPVAAGNISGIFFFLTSLVSNMQ